MYPVIQNITLHDESISVIEIYSESALKNNLTVIAPEDADKYGEACIQIIEGCSYEYKISDNLIIEEIPGIVKNSMTNKSSGRITPGIFTGTLVLRVLNTEGNEAGALNIEVKSVKTSYREDYRYMLESIAEYSTGLIMHFNSPVFQRFIPDAAGDPDTIYQRFVFIKSILESDEFMDAVHRIIYSPVFGWRNIDEEIDIRRIKHLRSSHLRKIASASNRIKINSDRFSDLKLNTVPAYINVDRKEDTSDTIENRFVKYVLQVYLSFCTAVKEKLCLSGSAERAFREAAALEEKLIEVLNHSFFTEISPPSTLPLNSPVLQRREGYREFLRVWLLFDLAAKLIWGAGNDVFQAGKRDVAKLYEYWLFFKLIELIKDLFQLESESIIELFEQTDDGLNIRLKSGVYTPVKGVYKNSVRNLNIEFSYNRTFGYSGAYPAAGSWSRGMRPDYSLTIWPAGFTPNEAEEQEVITHIHFDAKYKVERFTEIAGDNDINLEAEKEEQRTGTYKRADLLKMHAYKDAIRRTGGAYILYPGEDSTAAMKGFHEIIPGLGAFAIRPSKTDDGTAELKSFIETVLNHLLNRASQRERISFRSYDIHNTPPDKEVREPLPEKYMDKRVVPPDDTFVLVGYCKDDRHYEWINNKKLYNVRLYSEDDFLRMDRMIAGASYLLLHRKGELKTGDIWVLNKTGPRVFSGQELLELEYPAPSRKFYLVYDIIKVLIPEFTDTFWDIRGLDKYRTGRSSSLPFAVTLTELMAVKIKPG